MAKEYNTLMLFLNWFFLLKHILVYILIKNINININHYIKLVTKVVLNGFESSILREKIYINYLCVLLMLAMKRFSFTFNEYKTYVYKIIINKSFKKNNTRVGFLF